MLRESGGALEISDPITLGNMVARLIKDRAMLSSMANAAQNGVQGMSGANQRTLEAIDPLVVQIHLEKKA
jgi:3-deoxy-D-manno-octulosonic-acid transferase